MTQATSGPDREPASLTHLGVLLATGAEARSFLQGQLSADLDRLTPTAAQLAACNSAQGRVQAVLWIVERDDGIALVLPASLVDAIALRLRKYVLRAKVKIDANALSAAVLGAPPEADASHAHLQRGATSFISLPGHSSTLVLRPAAAAQTNDAANLQWRREDIAAGLPQVYPETQEAFVAQMLNLDALGGVSFNKGCYTGQEIIARAHFRGAVKRRMFRFSADDASPAPGTRISALDQSAGEVVDAVATKSGCEMLAVVSVSYIDASAPLSLPSGALLSRLPLPYSL